MVKDGWHKAYKPTPALWMFSKAKVSYINQDSGALLSGPLVNGGATWRLQHRVKLLGTNCILTCFLFVRLYPVVSGDSTLELRFPTGMVKEMFQNLKIHRGGTYLPPRDLISQYSEDCPQNKREVAVLQGIAWTSSAGLQPANQDM
jgi:hypothetical protein